MEFGFKRGSVDTAEKKKLKENSDGWGKYWCNWQRLAGIGARIESFVIILGPGKLN